MPHSPTPKPSSPEQRDREQSERFKQTARELGVELDEEKLKEALRRMGKQEMRDEPEEESPADDAQG